MRLDKYLVEESYFESRNRANEAIKAGLVTVNGKVAKASTKIDKDSTVSVEDEKFYVSRAGRKLESFLDEYLIDFADKRALDIGSSTGGFAQIILEKGVKSIDCVDVGKNQLHISLRNDDRLSLFEQTDIRDFKTDMPFDIVSCDVSFISILHIIDYINRLSCCYIVILYKPQFEVGKDTKRDNKGVVLDMDAIARRKEEFEVKASVLGWTLKYQAQSKIQGKEGNQEYLYHFVKSGS